MERTIRIGSFFRIILSVEKKEEVLDTPLPEELDGNATLAQ
jgi:hypothetical protein